MQMCQTERGEGQVAYALAHDIDTSSSPPHRCMALPAPGPLTLQLEDDMRLTEPIPDGWTCTACVSCCTNRSLPHCLSCTEAKILTRPHSHRARTGSLAFAPIVMFESSFSYRAFFYQVWSIAGQLRGHIEEK